MSAALIVRHPVADYDSWRKIFDEVEALQAQNGCTAKRVIHVPGNPNDVAAIHDFPTVAQAEAFANDPASGTANNPALRTAMERAGVTSDPRIEVFEDL
jgi:hypothetical protein